jgi:hypothetical protein
MPGSDNDVFMQCLQRRFSGLLRLQEIIAARNLSISHGVVVEKAVCESAIPALPLLYVRSHLGMSVNCESIAEVDDVMKARGLWRVPPTES